MAINNALNFVEELKLSEQEQMIARPIIEEVDDRLSFLKMSDWTI